MILWHCCVDCFIVVQFSRLNSSESEFFPSVSLSFLGVLWRVIISYAGRRHARPGVTGVCGHRGDVSDPYKQPDQVHLAAMGSNMSICCNICCALHFLIRKSLYNNLANVHIFILIFIKQHIH